MIRAKCFMATVNVPSRSKMAAEKAFSIVRDRHNLLLTGQCGTGKSYLLRRIQREMEEKKKIVAVTASTGMAALAVHGTTIHHWAGIMDGRYSKEKVVKMLDETTIRRIKETDILILDEIGMVSASIFKKLEYVVRKVRGNDTVFGGMQIIGCGDFKQLPPVPDPLHLDNGEYCFMVPEFESAFPKGHRINLTEVKRQDEPLLIQAIKELCDGNPSQQTHAFLRSLDRPIAAQEEPTMLFGTNFDVDFWNQEKVDAMPGEARHYRSQDTGDKALLTKCQAKKILTLKIGAPVVLLKNLGEKLVNGSKGIVHDLLDDTIIVNFDGALHHIERTLFERFDTRANFVRAARFQFPLKLAFALTVHKAQGRTEPFLEVDCFSFFAPGQLGVAIGRAVTIENLRVRNYNTESATMKHLPHVYEFYRTTSQDGPLLEDLSCCRMSKWEDDEGEEGNVDRDADSTTENPWPSSADIDEMPSTSSTVSGGLMDRITCQPPDGVQIDQTRLVQFVNVIQHKLDTLLPGTGKNKDAWSQAYRSFHQYLVSDEFKGQICTMFQTLSVTPACNKFATRLAFQVNEILVAEKAEGISKTQEAKNQATGKQLDMSDAGKAKIRYLAGACLSTIGKRQRSKALTDLTNTFHSQKRRHAYRQQRLLSSLRISEAEICESTEEPASLSEVQRKQSPGKGLYHIPDTVFGFFMQLHEIANKHLSSSCFHLHGKMTFTSCREAIFSNKDLQSEWLKLFGKVESNDERETELSDCLISELYQQVSEHFLRISFVEALHTVKEQLPKTKKQALRAKVEGATSSKCVKPVVKRKVVESNEYFCPVCNKICVDDPKTELEASIGCDGCDRWFHQKCAGIVRGYRKRKWLCDHCKGI